MVYVVELVPEVTVVTPAGVTAQLAVEVAVMVALTVTGLHSLQLLPSFDSTITPLGSGGKSAQARKYIVPGVPLGKVMDLEMLAVLPAEMLVKLEVTV